MVQILTKSPFAHFVTLLHHSLDPSRHPNQPRHTNLLGEESITKETKLKDLVKNLPRGLRIIWPDFSATPFSM